MSNDGGGDVRGPRRGSCAIRDVGACVGISMCMHDCVVSDMQASRHSCCYDVQCERTSALGDPSLGMWPLSL